MNEVVYSADAIDDLKSLEKQIAARIVKKIQFFSLQTDPLSFAKPLQGLGDRKYRFRVGDYRAVFRIDKNGEIQILFI